MEFDYEICRSEKRRKLTITVERDRSVVVHAPAETSEEKIREVVDAKRFWIFEKLHHVQKYTPPPPPGKELVNGEAALYLGRSYRIEVVDTDTQEIRFDHRFIIPKSYITRRKAVLRDWYRVRAKEVIFPRVQMFAARLGVDFNHARIVDNRYRWGSCTVKDNVNFNWRLVKAPMFVIDYVIVHELAHLIESNHTPRFWNIISAQTPTMEKARAWLRENGQILEEDI